MYKQNQKTVLSAVDSIFSFLLSKIHTSSPLLFISFHHLNPTNFLPEIFFTIQKSTAPHNIINK
jgi:hypothetical protein